MCIDDKGLGKEGYTILSNPKTGKIALMVMSCQTKHLKKVLDKIPGKIRRKVKVINKDLGLNYDWVARQSFSFAIRVADKFHIIKLGLECLQAIRVRYRQQLLRKERKHEEVRINAKKAGKDMKHFPKFKSEVFSNGETQKELLARSKGLLFKLPSQWSERQKKRAEILFLEYPEIKEAYDLILQFRIFYRSINEKQAKERLKEWTDSVGESELSEIKNFAFTVKNHQTEILNHFETKSSNAFAEGLNSHLQRFFVANYGIRNRDFFHFRIKLAFS